MTTLTINGQPHEVDAPDDMPLLWAIRDLVGYTGTKYGCGRGLCGACTVHLDGQPTRSCITPLSAVGQREITTIEAIAEDATGASVQQAWRELEVVQCGYCQSGQIMAATALLRDNPAPDDAAIDGAMRGNLCRCATYVRIRAAIHAAAESLGQEET
ncbi:2Fe-2S iron-sulfur cluster-binding protein [Halomonas stenophila]|uniref:Isoquinoline 1-oxidoreductase alpha subunit n=1 Tax=Halomonas stenophila TaxID=795312 RepID=A0A7W5HMK5_9GAMM|nr:isoquinoline 1-oxidoreductase alpha subunit [Halomonas stenophila]